MEGQNRRRGSFVVAGTRIRRGWTRGPLVEVLWKYDIFGSGVDRRRNDKQSSGFSTVSTSSRAQEEMQEVQDVEDVRRPQRCDYAVHCMDRRVLTDEIWSSCAVLTIWSTSIRRPRIPSGSDPQRSTALPQRIISKSTTIFDFRMNMCGGTAGKFSDTSELYSLSHTR